MEIMSRKLSSFAMWLSAWTVAWILVHYHPHDATWWYQMAFSAPYYHPAGYIGAYCAALLLAACGSAAWFLPCIASALGACLYTHMAREHVIKIAWNLCGMLLLVAVLCEHYHVTFRGASAGGAWGFFLYMWFSKCVPVSMIPVIISSIMSGIIYATIGSTRLYRTMRYSRYVATRYVVLPVEHIWYRMLSLHRSHHNTGHQAKVESNPMPVESSLASSSLGQNTHDSSSPTEIRIPHKKVPRVVSVPTGYQKPPLAALLGSRKTKEKEVVAAGPYESQARVLEQKLEQFGIKGKVVDIVVGPVVVLFEYQPHSSVPINKIIAREHDLALALQATSFRIIAPIPGKAVVGFESSRATQELVSFAHYHEDLFAHGYRLPLLIGVTTAGAPLSLDLVSLPHLLVAGSTGSGKSVALHTLIVSILSARTSEETKLILIDPKRLEFAAYADIPHLLFPIIVEAKEAVKVLRWVVQEMDRRYLMLAQAGVTDIVSYRATGELLPEIVLVIDEWADLMMSGGKDAEQSLVRLAQMARAAGIHVIVATQRPSVDIITGLIKVNIPARIACKVISKVDSRTIIDTSGAEKLLGKGDMLIMIPGKPITRVHGMYISAREVQEVACHLRRQGSAAYHTLYQTASTPLDVATDDQELYQQVLDLIKSVDEISISYLQRKLRIGYNRSARMIDYLEAHGMILPSDGGKTRKVLHSKDV